MSGRAQAANLTGMLSQIAKDVGEMGKGYEWTHNAIRTAAMPKLDESDPASLSKYAEWARRNGKEDVAALYSEKAGELTKRQNQQKGMAAMMNLSANLSQNWDKYSEQQRVAIQAAMGDVAQRYDMDPSYVNQLMQNTEAMRNTRVGQKQTDRGLDLEEERNAITATDVSNRFILGKEKNAIAWDQLDLEEQKLVQRIKEHDENLQARLKEINIEDQRVTQWIRASEAQVDSVTLDTEIKRAENERLKGYREHMASANNLMPSMGEPTEKIETARRLYLNGVPEDQREQAGKAWDEVQERRQAIYTNQQIVEENQQNLESARPYTKEGLVAMGMPPSQADKIMGLSGQQARTAAVQSWITASSTRPEYAMPSAEAMDTYAPIANNYFKEIFGSGILWSGIGNGVWDDEIKRDMTIAMARASASDRTPEEVRMAGLEAAIPYLVKTEDKKKTESFASLYNSLDAAGSLGADE